TAWTAQCLFQNIAARRKHLPRPLVDFSTTAATNASAGARRLAARHATQLSEEKCRCRLRAWFYHRWRRLPCWQRCRRERISDPLPPSPEAEAGMGMAAAEAGTAAEAAVGTAAELAPAASVPAQARVPARAASAPVRAA